INAVALNAWQQVAVTYNDNTDRMPHLYINGREVTYAAQAAVTGTVIVSAQPFIIGDRAAGDRSFAGILDEMQVYSGALSAADILSLYNSAPPYDTTPPTVSITAPATGAMV